jgi:hypothetical protein
MHLFWIASRAAVRVIEPEEPASIPADRLPASQSGTEALEQPESKLSWRR